VKLAMTLFAVLLLAACGSGDDSGAPPGAQVTTSAAAVTTSTASTSTAVVTTSTTTTALSDEAQVRAAFVAFFDGANRNIDQKVGLLENGERYRQMLVDAAADPQAQQLRATVRSVQFPADAACASLGVAGPCAKVTFDLLLGAFPALAAHDGPAVKIGGVWKVSAKAWCDVVAIGGNTCPS